MNAIIFVVTATIGLACCVSIARNTLRVKRGEKTQLTVWQYYVLAFLVGTYTSQWTLVHQ